MGWWAGASFQQECFRSWFSVLGGELEPRRGGRRMKPKEVHRSHALVLREPIKAPERSWSSL